MAPRRRLGVALLVEAPLADEIDGLRRALRDPSLDRIAPHVTLVPPVNVRESDLPAALAVLRAAAAGSGPLRLHLGPPGSFLPANPVLHLPVGGDLPALRSLRDAVFTGPLLRDLSWPWVPHVTLADGVDEDRIAAAVATLAGYQVVADVERVVLLEERRRDPAPAGPGGRSWVPVADARLGPAVVVGRGGLEVTLVEGRLPGPDAVALVAAAAPGAGPVDPQLVVSALVDGELAGVAATWDDDGGRCVAVLVDPARRRSGIGRQLLARIHDATGRSPHPAPAARAVGPAGFYAACGAWAVPDR